MAAIQELEKAIKTYVTTLDCDTHPNVCRLRDKNYSYLKDQVLNLILEDEPTPSVQTAVAELEVALGDSEQNQLD